MDCLYQAEFCLNRSISPSLISPPKVFLIFQNFQSSNPPFTSVELDHSDSGREGCTVTTLTVTAEPKNWQNAIKVAVQEVCIFCSSVPTLHYIANAIPFNILFFSISILLLPVPPYLLIVE